jgi:two-component sensor histidine kinase
LYDDKNGYFMKKRKLYSTLKISFIYLLAGCIWIAASDNVLEIFVPDKESYALLQTYKGWFFIVISSALIFYLLYKELKIRDKIEESLNRTIVDKKNLLNEIHHRVNNNLNSIISLLYLEKEKTDSIESQKIIETLSGRIYTMSLVHENLYKSDNFSQIYLNNYIPELLSYIKKQQNKKADHISLSCDIDNTSLNISKAIPFGMMIYEIINNSFKHGFPENWSGKITITVKSFSNICHIRIEDNGIGIPEDNNLSENGHGLELIKLLAGQLSGQIEQISGNGLKYTIKFPAESNND